MRKPVVQILIGVLVLLISIFISYLIGIFESDIKFSVQVLIALTLFTAASTIEIILHTHFFSKLKKTDFDIWLVKSRGETILCEIRQKYHQVVTDSLGETDIFILHLEKEFKKILHKITDVADRKELFVNADYFLNADNILDVLRTQSDKTWRYTWQIENPDEKLFELESWLQFFEKTSKMAQLKQISEIQVLIIINEKGFISHPRIVKLFDFFKSNDRINCKIITKERFTKLCDYNSFSSYNDFGIYSNILLFIETDYNPEVGGIFSKDPNKIDDYSNLFNQIWTTDSVSDLNPSNSSEIVAIKDLINFDFNFFAGNSNNKNEI